MDEPLVNSDQAESEPQRRGGPWNLIFLVVIITLIGIWLVPGETPDPATMAVSPMPRHGPSLMPATPAAEPVGKTPAAGLMTPDAPSPGEFGPAPVVEDSSPGAKARRLIAQMRASGELALDRIFDAARQAQADGELPDAYLLHFFAAREGHAASALELAHQADPARYTPGESLFDKPDLAQAHKWYQAAADSGSSEASAELAALRARIERMAAGGDPQAQRIALQWQ